MKSTILLITTLVFIFSLGLSAQQQTTDGGYIIGGITDSYPDGSAFYDFLLYKLDASGAKQWRKNYGGAEDDVYSAVIQTADGGYAVCGYSEFYTHGADDFLVYKLNASGQKQWRKNYGGVNNDHPYGIVQTADGGFVVSGDTRSYTNGEQDLLVYRLSASGAKLWRKNFGGLDSDWYGFIDATSDGGFIICGTTYSYSNGSNDFLVYKLDASGSKQWRKNFGGEGADYAHSVRQTPDGGYIVAGRGRSYATTAAGRLAAGTYDFLVYKLDVAGKKQWRKSLGGTSNDHCYDAHPTADGGYLLLGDSYSYYHGTSGTDFLAYKLGTSGAKLWRKNYGGEVNDKGYRVCFASDGGYLLLGKTMSYTTSDGYWDLLIYKVNASGVKQWRKNYGGDGHDMTSFN